MSSIWLFDNQLCYSLINQIKMAKIFYSYNIPMQIRSDQEQFQQLDDVGSQIKQSIRHPPQQKQRKSYRVEIKEVQHPNEASLLQNQYYLVSVFKDDQVVKKQLKKRFSDFDTLFQILFRQYQGHILPAFPENGIMSYVKSKVSLTKDDKFLKQRIAMVERFLTILQNDPYLNQQKCSEMKAFLSDNGFDLFKEKQKQKSQGILSSSWNKLISFMKVNKQSKFKIYQEQLVQNKLEFEQLQKKAKCLLDLLEQQKAWINNIASKDLPVPLINEYIDRQKKVCEFQQTNLAKIKKLCFEVGCQNEDYLMVFKIIRSLDELKNNQNSYTALDKAERIFTSQYDIFKNKKKQTLKKITNSFDQILKDISKIDQKF